MASNATSRDAIKLPIINISKSTPEVGKQMLEAATKYGFLYIDTASTGFTEELVNREFNLSRQFFALAEVDKEKCKIDTTNRGWTGMHGEILDPKAQKRGDFKQAFNMGEFVHEMPQQPMPDIFHGVVPQLAAFEEQCRLTCNRVLDLLALGLEIEEPNFFSSRHTQPSGCTVRMLHYPAIPEDSDYDPLVDIRAGAHSDYGSCTLLFQRPSQPGLEIRTSEDTWAPVAVIPDGYHSVTLPPILVNIGDLLSYWTNGLLKSTVHRVIFPKGAKKEGDDRYSIVYFCHPGNDMKLVPVPSRLVEDHVLADGTEVGYGGGAATKRAITAKEHLQNRLTATYGFRMEASSAAVTTGTV